MYQTRAINPVPPQNYPTLPRTYFVEYDESFLSELGNKPLSFSVNNGTDTAAPNLAKSFLGSIQHSGIGYKLRDTFDDLIKAVSLTIDDDDDLEKLTELGAVKNVWPVSIIERPKFFVNNDVVQPTVFFADELTGVAQVQQTLGFNGKGIKVGIIDSGIDYTHPAFGNCYKTPSCKIQFGFDFVGDNFNGSNTPISDDDPLDTCAGHGTHVAGILAADDKVKNFTGVAPGVTLGIYRVFGCTGSSANDLVIKAMERAYKDGMDIINLSLGGAAGWDQSPDAVVAQRLSQKNLTIVSAIGNDGDQGIFMASTPSVASSAISVASVDNAKVLGFFLNTSTVADRKIQYLTANATRYNITGIPQIVSISNNTNVIDDACTSIPENSLKGKIALVRRGSCSFTQKLLNSQGGGAIGVLFYDNVASVLFPLITNSPSIRIPSALISSSDGVFLFDQIRKNKMVSLKFSDKMEAFVNPSGGTISDFSSYGPSNELDLKPEIAAPGGTIFSTYPQKLGSYKTLSGSSMASPYMAGCVAILFQAKGRMSPVKARNLLMNTARPVELLPNEKNQTVHTSVTRQGAGLINLLNALTATTVITPGKLALNDSANFNDDTTLTIINTGKKTAKYSVSHVGAEAINGYGTDVFVPIQEPISQKSFAKVLFSESSFTLKNGESRKVKVKITPPSNLDDAKHFMYSGFILFTDNTNKKTFSVPYMGMKGSMKTLPIIDILSGTPFIQTPSQQLITSRSEKVTFTLVGEDSPLLVVRLAQGTRILTIDVTPANTKVQSNIGSPAIGSASKSITPPPKKTSSQADSIEKSRKHRNKRTLRFMRRDNPELAPTINMTSPVKEDPKPPEGIPLLVPDSLGTIQHEGVNLFLSRNNNSTTKLATPFLWNGKINKKDGQRNFDVPNGSYRLVVSALKPFGDQKKKIDWEIWVSPQIDIKRTKAADILAKL
ncbi:hypothetical protein G9A89_012564 [Geosiphon pyriformis]|nr:hypothetical protein G9A89_012564 [Geosiphon pyriformis]